MLRKTEPYNVGVIVGRFQVNELHPGHIELLDWVNENHDTMIVAIGCSKVQSQTNPLPYHARQVMLAEKYPNAIFFPIFDEESDISWSRTLDEAVGRSIREPETVCLYGSRDGFIEYYHGKYPTEELISTQPFWSGTDVRRKIANKVLSSSDFRAGIIYAMSGGWPKVIPTVDAVIFSQSPYDEGATRNSIYMVRKNGQDKLRFPGGYVEPGMTYKEAIRKEIREEVGSLEVDGLQYLGDTEIDDWRYGQRDTIHTTVFMGFRQFGMTGDFTDKEEIAEVREVTLTNLFLGYKNSVVPEHHVIVEMLKENQEDWERKVELAKEVIEALDEGTQEENATA